MKKLRTHQIRRLTTEQAKRSAKHPVVCVVENVRSIHNVGSMFRTADAAGIEHIYLTGITGTPENRLMRKAALGAEEVVSWTHSSDIQKVILNLKNSDYTIVALEITDSRTSIADITPDSFPLALVVGNEITGLSDETLELCDFSIEIDQYGSKHSLNVAVAFGIAVYGIVDRFRKTSQTTGSV